MFLIERFNRVIAVNEEKMTDYVKICYLLLFALVSSVEGSGYSCEDIDPAACAQMAKQNANLCSEPILSQTACPKLCGKCPITCYNCNTTSPDISSCNTVTCDKNKLCMVKMVKSTRTGHIRYSLGCASDTVCDGGRKRAQHDRQSRSVKIDCCDDDLCNTPLATTLSTTASTTTSTTTILPTTTSSTAVSTTTITTAVTTADPCASSPCGHGACSRLTSGTFLCVCMSGFTGSRCEKADPCASSPCVHGACLRLSNQAFRCSCSPGYIGSHCDKADPCASSPCVHGACLRLSNQMFRCSCSPGYIGSRCDTADPCASSLCVHGTCLTLSYQTFRCSCSPGYTGVRCDKACARDIVVVVDQTSINDRTVRSFLRQLVTSMNVGVNGIQMELASFDYTVYHHWELNRYRDKYRLSAAIGGLSATTPRGYPDIVQAYLSLLTYNTINQAGGRYGDRQHVPDVAIVITRGFIHTLDQYNAHLLHSFFTGGVITVGVGSVNHPTLDLIATDRSHALYVNSYADLDAKHFKTNILNLICS
ncbi:fibropellin-1-like isoform X2 [Mercenaria mercenaria]|uniref:fibropellin-1-like isoform X2 n=1 Tax=Mercenaria mercenaria TaxID=6596 RepID=UPI00234E7381|nr:fibropellin-1-like isoform X2 [Mercenaria mercenaria]